MRGRDLWRWWGRLRRFDAIGMGAARAGGQLDCAQPVGSHAVVGEAGAIGEPGY